MWVSVGQALSAYSRAEQILFNSIRKFVDMPEDPPVEASINSTCSDYGLSEIKLVKNYNLFEKNYYVKCFFCGADRKEMLQYSKVLRSMRLKLIVNKR